MEETKAFAEKSLLEKKEYLESQAVRYAGVFERYKAMGKELIKILEAAAKGRAPEAIVQARAKKLPSCVRKIPRCPEMKDHVSELNDLCGARVIVHTRSEVDRMCQFIMEEHRKAEKQEGGILKINWEHSRPDPLSRHGTSEFGYRSAHFIVQLCRPPAGTNPAAPVMPNTPAGTPGAAGQADIYPDEKAPMRAEIQVRTLLEHTWSDFTHDRVYKAKFEVPDKWQRQLSAIAAQFEEDDQDFERIAAGLAEYAANYGAYMSRKEMAADLDV